MAAETLSEIFNLLAQGKLGPAMTQLENLLYTYPQLYSNEQLLKLRDDYQLMADYWLKGYPDPQRQEVFHQLLQRLFMLATDVTIRNRLRGSTFLYGVYKRTRNSGRNWSVAAIRTELEGFVAEAAMLELQPENVRGEHRRQLYEKHQRMANDMFDYVWTSGSWNESLAEAFLDILLTPTIDIIDQQLMVSAVTLSLLNAFDPHKWLLLADVYQRATDESLRQRALVGCMFCLDYERMQVFPETIKRMEALLSDERCRKEITELQIQVYYCINAEDDNRRIQQEIMPNIIKNGEYRVTRNGVEEVEEDTLQNILDPEAAERNIAQMEESVKKMMDMQRSGSDIYFGGFAQMKRYPFFNDISNWFVPFYSNHPAIVGTQGEGRGHNFLRSILGSLAFCDSDKYSFALAFDYTVKRMPEKLLDLLDSGEAQMLGSKFEATDDERPAYLRRLYLQNLYRFFRVFPHRSDFVSPFDDTHRLLFFASPAIASVRHLPEPLGKAMSEQFGQVASFLFKRKYHADAQRLVEAFDGEETPAMLLVYANVLMMQHTDLAETAVDAYRRALKCLGDGSGSVSLEQVLTGLARAEFRCSNYQAAMDCYDQLLDLHPDKKSLLLNKSVCLMRLAQYEEALKMLYKLNYEEPDDDNVSRILAWALVGSGKYEQAAKIYTRLLDDDPTSVVDDMLNYGYCLWMAGDAAGAATMLRQYAAQMGDNGDMHKEFFTAEHDLLARKGITDVEIQLMLDQISGMAGKW